MPKFRFHKLAAIVVLIGFAGWMATGEFSSVGSASADNKPKAGEVEQPKAADSGKPQTGEQGAAKPGTAEAEQPKAPLRTVAVITPPRRTYA
ncbi:MAG: efflux transporter periplasmic adaptor subunit, partial [Mesorhizobium sp.]